MNERERGRVGERKSEREKERDWVCVREREREREREKERITETPPKEWKNNRNKRAIGAQDVDKFLGVKLGSL